MGIAVTNSSLLQEVLSSLGSRLSADQILTEQETSLFYLRDTIPGDQSLPIVILPKSQADIVFILRVASTFEVAVHPISTGNNWGYGGSLRHSDRCQIVLDLRKMNSVLEVSKELAYAVIEPGVTQGQLAECLRSFGLQMDPSGAGPNTSVLGNILERGYGAGTYGDHFMSLCGLEVILPNGKLIRTGFWNQCERLKGEHVFKWGIGPFTEGLFTQSNFGVVTKAAVWLHPQPEAYEVCYFSFNSAAKFAQCTNDFRKLLLHGVLNSAINVASKSRIISTRQQYPWSAAKGVTPLPNQLFAGGSDKVAAWTGCVALSGTKRQVKMQKAELKSVLKSQAETWSFVSEKKLKIFSLLARKKSLTKIDSARRAFELLRGEPSELTLRSPYWRNKQQIPQQDLHPARDNCGLIWFAPIVPMVQKRILEFIECVKPVVASYKFDDCFGFLSVNQRAFLCSFPILFDRDNPSECEKAINCYKELSLLCQQKGFFSYRRGIHYMPHKNCSTDWERDYWSFIQDLKNCIDPKGIIAPGRYAD